MKREGPSPQGGGSQPVGQDADLLGLAPALHAFLTESKWDDGKKRDLGTVMLVVEGGWWKAWLHDRDGKRSAWFAGATVQELVLAVDEQLSEGRVAWRPDRR